MARVFKIKAFAKDARKAKIDDPELCRVARKAEQGQFHADYGGGVLKWKMNNAMHRGLILMKGGENYVYALLFAKNDRDNITDKEEVVLKELANIYARMDNTALTAAKKSGEIVETCVTSEEEDEDDGEAGS